MIKIKSGVTRIVFLIGKYAIKVPNFRYQHKHFLHGCFANFSERVHTKSMKCLPEMYIKIAPTVFCAWFGLISIQQRVVLMNRDLSENEIEYFNFLTTDIKKENFGWLKRHLVCIDYE